MAHDGSANRILAGLPGSEWKLLEPMLHAHQVKVREVASGPNGSPDHVYFPIDAVFSMMASLRDAPAVEVATVGREGMVGMPVFFGGGSAAIQTYCQVPGVALGMSARSFKTLVERQNGVRRRLQLYTQALFTQLAQGVACNRAHSIDKRCARWLLQTHDRVGRDQFPLTQEFLAQMLGVRRAAANVVAQALQKGGLIEYARGEIRIIDRKGLEGAACECYSIVAGEYDRLLGRG